MLGSLIVVIFFIIGVILGRFDLLPESIEGYDFSMQVLYLLLFFVGIGIGADKKSIDILKTLNYKIVLVPIMVIVGTLVGTAAISPFVPEYSLKELLAVGAGFGYYSLSSIYITEIAGETLGVIALLSNITREIITLLFTPILVKIFGKLAGVASGGATSMDTCLPIITKYSGKEWVMISIFSGFILTLIVPILVPLILEM